MVKIKFLKSLMPKLACSSERETNIYSILKKKKNDRYKFSTKKKKIYKYISTQSFMMYYET